MKTTSLFIIVLIIVMAFSVLFQKSRPKYVVNDGYAHGTTYHIVYKSMGGKNFKVEIDSVLKEINNSMSLWDSNSVISKINRNVPDVKVDKHLNTVITKAREISEQTNGAFDVTVGSLVDAWGFWFKKPMNTDSTLIDSLLNYVGYRKIHLTDNVLVKENRRTMIDVNAIAGGYAVDAVVKLLESKKIKHYIVEIGGEVRASGENKSGKIWRIGIDQPISDSTSTERELQTVLSIKDLSIATSGNYRKFYIKDGKKYAHTIDPKTGYPVQHELLSASIIAKDCMTADAYATACMVLGLKKSIELLKKHTELQAYFIYLNDKNEYEIFYTDGVKAMIEE
jgi:thiamine biosynthesis lipoprotein